MAAVPIRQQVLSAFESAISVELAALTPAVPVESQRREEVITFPSVLIIDGDEGEPEEGIGIVKRFALVRAEGYVQAATQAVLRNARENLQAHVIHAIASDYTLGGWAVNATHTRTDTLTIMHSAQPSTAFSLDFEIEYWTKPGDPFTLGP